MNQKMSQNRIVSYLCEGRSWFASRFMALKNRDVQQDTP